MITTRQTIKEYSSLNGNFPADFVEDYMGIKSDVDRINAMLSQLAPQFGEGSPEGEVASNLNRTYFDITGGTSVMYVNPSVGVSDGWVLV